MGELAPHDGGNEQAQQFGPERDLLSAENRQQIEDYLRGMEGRGTPVSRTQVEAGALGMQRQDEAWQRYRDEMPRPLPIQHAEQAAGQEVTVEVLRRDLEVMKVFRDSSELSETSRHYLDDAIAAMAGDLPGEESEMDKGFRQ